MVTSQNDSMLQEKTITFPRTKGVAAVVGVLLATVVGTSGVVAVAVVVAVVGTSLCIACWSFGFVELLSAGYTARLGTNLWSICQPYQCFQANKLSKKKIKYGPKYLQDKQYPNC